jgi:hypothetical protein
MGGILEKIYIEAYATSDIGVDHQQESGIQLGQPFPIWTTWTCAHKEQDFRGKRGQFLDMIWLLGCGAGLSFHSME